MNSVWINELVRSVGVVNIHSREITLIRVRLGVRERTAPLSFISTWLHLSCD